MVLILVLQSLPFTRHWAASGLFIHTLSCSGKWQPLTKLKFGRITLRRKQAILRQLEEFEREQNCESDVEIDVGEEGDEIEDSEAESDPEENIPLASLQTTWRRATAPSAVREFALPTGPVHTLPLNAKPLDYFFLFVPEHFFQTAADETNRYAKQKIAAKGLATDPLWTDTSAEEIRAGRRTAKNGQVETSYMCQFCQVSLCHHKRDCFRDYHQQNLVGQPTQEKNK